MTMTNWQERVVAEKAELDEKIEKLFAFINDESEVSVYKSLPEEERSLLMDQCSAMEEYRNILGLRIMNFKGEA